MKKINGTMIPKHKKPSKGSVKCNKCGKELTPSEACYYVDGCNYAISNSARPYCRECYMEKYKTRG